MIAAQNVLAEAEKYLDTVSICANQIGQRAALYGLRHLGRWVRGEREEILRRRMAVEAAFARQNPLRLLSVGAYFAFVEHPWDIPSDELAPRLVREQGVLILPGTMFVPPELAELGRKTLRVAFANADASGIDAFAERIASFAP